MHPVSTALFLLGYGLGLPIAARLPRIVAAHQRLAFAGHQLGIGVALLGWVISGRVIMALIHGVWLVAARIWFGLGARTPDDGAPAPG